MMATRVEERGRHQDLRAIATLPQALAHFVTHVGPMLMVFFFSISLGLRIFWVDVALAWTDLATVVGVVLLWWFQEWFAHVTLLHARPRKIGRWTLDPAFARVHREHHREPWHPVLVFVPVPYVVLGYVVSVSLFCILMPTIAVGLTASAAYCLMGVLYEWTHFLVHTRYKPRSAFVKSIWRNHRLHHFKNENYWYGLSVTWVDEVFGTAPEHAQVETSTTTRMLDTDNAEI